MNKHIAIKKLSTFAKQQKIVWQNFHDIGREREKNVHLKFVIWIKNLLSLNNALNLLKQYTKLQSKMANFNYFLVPFEKKLFCFPYPPTLLLSYKPRKIYVVWALSQPFAPNKRRSEIAWHAWGALALENSPPFSSSLVSQLVIGVNFQKPLQFIVMKTSNFQNACNVCAMARVGRGIKLTPNNTHTPPTTRA